MSPFPYERDLLKHSVRKEIWLPACKKRHELVRAGLTKKQQRRLRYFTFCATGAIDVLMLDVEKVIGPSSKGRFDTVTFFDRRPEDIIETEKNIPGAFGIPGDFTKVVLSGTAEDMVDPLAAPKNDLDTLANEKLQIERAQCRDLIGRFPFDIMNLDLQNFLFKNSDPPPGDLIRALRKVFEWQTRPIDGLGPLPGFTLFFTTQIGPSNLNPDYQSMLVNNMDQNLRDLPELVELLRTRTGHDQPQTVLTTNFDAFFKIAAPKFLIHTLQEEDWYVDSEHGFGMVEFVRNPEGTPYTMLHMAMQVNRCDPRRELRAPNTLPNNVTEAHRRIISDLFTRDHAPITNESVDQTELEAHLGLIVSRQKKYRVEVGAEE
jgi:hypothetical protein